PRPAHIKNHRAFQGGAYWMVSVTFSVGWSPPGAGSPTKRKSHDVWYFQKENSQGHYRSEEDGEPRRSGGDRLGCVFHCIR
ncbi:hypothetical protein C9300_25875, partial [Escherichia coli]